MLVLLLGAEVALVDVVAFSGQRPQTGGADQHVFVRADTAVAAVSTEVVHGCVHILLDPGIAQMRGCTFLACFLFHIQSRA